MERIQQLKKQAMENPQKSKKCTTCKKKPVVTTLPEVEEINIFPTNQEIETAYANLTSYSGVREQDKQQIEYIYGMIFKESFEWNCSSCVSVQGRKFHNYMVQNKLKI